MIQYGGALRTVNGREIEVLRDGANILIADSGRAEVGEREIRLTYPQLLQLLTRLNEAAKDAAGGGARR